MHWSRSFIPTLRDDPTDSELTSHKLLIRAAIVRQLTAGVYSCLPLGRRTMLKIANVIREEMNAGSAQEFFLPTLHPSDLIPESGTRPDMGGNMFRFKDRTGRDLCLGTQHEQIFTDIARKEIRSYKDLPQIWYQLQTGFRDESRPKSGLLRLRQFSLMGSCSFDLDEHGLDRSYQLHRDIFRRICARCGLNCVPVQAGPGAMGGSQSEDLMVPIEAGEDLIASCECGYSASLECATSKIPEIPDSRADSGLREIHTPGQKTIAEVGEFLKVPPEYQIKSLVYMVNDEPCLLLLRGDHQLNEAKLMALMKTAQTRPALPEEIREKFGADAGSLGPVGISRIPIYADLGLQGRQNMTAGANKDDYHLQGVTPDVHFKPFWADIRSVEKGEACANCGSSLDVFRAVAVGHMAKWGDAYSRGMGATVLSADGRQVPLAMGTYQIGLERIMSSVVEMSHDSDGIVWPVEIAPFTVIVTPIQYKEQLRSAADKLYADLWTAGIDALLDDRAERAGVKFKDADLIGIPYRVVIGAEKLKQGRIELVERATKKTELIEPAGLIGALKARLGK